MSFKRAVRETPDLREAWRPGLGALRPKDRPHVAAEDPRSFRGSVDIDRALQNRHPNAHRWDFAIGYRHTRWSEDFVYWVEVHTADDKEVAVVLDKLRWLKDWLAGDGARLSHFKRDFIWVSSGRTSFTLSAPQLKRFAELGLQHRGTVLRISSAR